MSQIYINKDIYPLNFKSVNVHKSCDWHIHTEADVTMTALGWYFLCFFHMYFIICTSQIRQAYCCLYVRWLLAGKVHWTTLYSLRCVVTQFQTTIHLYLNWVIPILFDTLFFTFLFFFCMIHDVNKIKHNSKFLIDVLNFLCKSFWLTSATVKIKNNSTNF